MKLQVGLLHLTGRNSDRAEMPEMLGGFYAAAAETSGEVCEGPLSIAYRGDRITNEDDFEVQPLQSGNYVMTWDGRLDNREELATRIGVNHLEVVPDVSIVLGAYERFGESIFNDLIGEFALVLWCRDSRRLRFVRSTCGARTLYYVLGKDRLIWCSNFARLVRISNVDLAVDDDYVFNYFVSEPDTTKTALSRVRAIPANRVVCFEDGRLTSSSELWDPTRVPRLTYRRDQDYEDECRHRIKEAVKVRLRSKFPVFAELSGGLDSSTIVLMADEALTEQNHSRANLQTVSCVYEYSTTCDEQRFIGAVTEKRGHETHLIREDDQCATTGLVEDPPFSGIPNPLHCMPGRYETISRLMQQEQARVLLTGNGGDHLFFSSSDGTTVVADEVFDLHLVGAHRQCCTWSRIACVPYYRLMKQASLQAFKDFFGGGGIYLRPQIPGWMNLPSTVEVTSSPVDFEKFKGWRVSPSRRAQVFFVERLLRMLAGGFMNEYEGIYVSHPYSDRRLMEFCIATPITQFLRDGATRSLMRRAMVGVLPSKTLRRVTKGLIDETMVRAVLREWHRISGVRDWEVCRRDYVKAAELDRKMNRVRLGFLDLLGPIFRLFSLERWLRSLRNVKNTSGDCLAAVSG